jgi:hypothetical protein
MSNYTALYTQFLNACRTGIENNLSEEGVENALGVEKGMLKALKAKLFAAHSNNDITDFMLKRVKEVYKLLNAQGVKQKASTIKEPLGFVFEPEIGNELHGTKDAYSDKKTDTEKSFENRTKVDVIRDDSERILYYTFDIQVRGERPLKGKLSREEMEKIHKIYPNGSMNLVSQEFPYYDIRDIKRILRAFNITKTQLFPQHVVEENEPSDVAKFAHKAKEVTAYKRFVEKKGDFVSNELRKTQGQLYEVTEDRAWAEDLIRTYLSSPPKFDFQELQFNTEKNPSDIIAIFGDVHFGKKFECSKVPFGRGTSSKILRERCLSIAHYAAKAAVENKSNTLHLVNMGDLFESVLADGMHPSHLKHMDLTGHEQIMFALEVFKEMITIIKVEYKFRGRIIIHGIGGNHDRMGKDRQEDKTRTATELFYGFLKIWFADIYGTHLEIVYYQDGVIRFAFPGVSFIGFHGDNSLIKRSATELMNVFKVGDSSNYTLVCNAHFHGLKSTVIDEGPNFLKLGVGAVCSTDQYVQFELGGGAQPSCLIAAKADVYGVDFLKKTLH